MLIITINISYFILLTIGIFYVDKMTYVSYNKYNL